jgi:mannosyltransferase
MVPVPRSPDDSRARLALLVITVIGAAWRIVGLDAESFWHDEVITYDLLTMPWGEAMSDLVEDGHTPLYPLLLRGWASLFGTSPAALRGLSALLGTLAIPLLYAIAARWRGPVAGLAAALLAAFSGLLVHYSQEARDYAVFFLVATASFAALDRASREPTPARLTVWSLTLALSLWSSVFGLAVLVTQVLWLAGIAACALAERNPPRPTWRAAVPWVVALAAALLAFTPWLVVLARRADVVANEFWVPRPGWESIEGTLTSFAWTRRGLALLLPLVLVGVWRETMAQGADRRRGTLLLAWFLGPLLIPFLFSHLAFPVFVPRGAIVAAGALFLLAALGLEALRPRRAWFLAGAAAVVLALAFGVHRQLQRVEREDWRAVARHLSAMARAEDLVLVADPRQVLAIRIYAPEAPYAVLHGQGPDLAGGPPQGHDRVWVVRSEHGRHLRDLIEGWSASGWSARDRATFPRLVVERWER